MYKKSKKTPGQEAAELYQIFKEEQIPIILKLLHNIEKEEIVPNTFYKASIILVPKSDKDTSKRKENYRPTSLMNIDVKILNKILANQIQQHTERIVDQGQVGSMLGCKDGSHANQ
jgi:hypothetical protein